MPGPILLADSGATKTEWALIRNGRATKAQTPGISPYFMDQATIVATLQSSLKPSFLQATPSSIFFYGTGCAAKPNARLVSRALRVIWSAATTQVADDLLGATRSLCGHEPGIACILGTGSSSAHFNGKKIIEQRAGLGYVLGDEGSGSYLGKKLIQYFLYDLFDQELKEKFRDQFQLDRTAILDSVYKKPSPSRFLASFTPFLAENRGHYMIENILEDGLQDFFFNHIRRFKQADRLPIHFTGSISYVFRDWIQMLCQRNSFKLGNIEPKPMSGLIRYHQSK